MKLTMKDKAVKFLKIYLVFMAVALAINLSMEMLIPTPEEKHASGIIMFYSLFSVAGSAIFLFKDYRPVIMGMLSFILGFIFEFTFMRPDWVMKIYALQIGGGEIVAVFVSAIYWFIPWGVPAYIIKKSIKKFKIV